VINELRYKPLGMFFPGWLNELRTKSGAYVIRNKATHEILYVGESHTGRLAKTIKRHFYAWKDDPARVHHVFARRSVEVATRVTPPDKAKEEEKALIARLQPEKNVQGQVDDTPAF
jgi:hypothetical protein